MPTSIPGTALESPPMRPSWVAQDREEIPFDLRPVPRCGGDIAVRPDQPDPSVLERLAGFGLQHLGILRDQFGPLGVRGGEDRESRCRSRSNWVRSADN